MRKIMAVCVLTLLTNMALAAPPLNILLTNDDGYLAPGIQALRASLLEAGHNVFLIAPATNQSGSGTSITGQGVAYTSHGNQVWSVAGRPADAVRLGIGHILQDNPPDIVLSGINFGQNVGQDVVVSGTIGAAVTAVQLGFPAMAASAEINFDEAATGFPS
ncbi:MAG: acid phosphatase, partial [Pseudomonadales bacterium]|nr:acid phosphatase [Pseudomonadales bacterium]